jgi:hypothetical protein
MKASQTSFFHESPGETRLMNGIRGIRRITACTPPPAPGDR